MEDDNSNCSYCVNGLRAFYVLSLWLDVIKERGAFCVFERHVDWQKAQQCSLVLCVYAIAQFAPFQERVKKYHMLKVYLYRTKRLALLKVVICFVELALSETR